ncbi:MAG: M91 family zinc metallopeptidase [Luteimonas sp.]
MNASLDTRNAPLDQTSQIWDNPQRPDALNRGAGTNEVQAVDQADVTGNAARDAATPIDGNATNTGTRTQTTSSSGQPLFIDQLGNTAQVEITRERTAEDNGGGNFSVLADQLVFKTGDSSDRVSLTRTTDGGLSLDVNGEQYDVSLAPGQQLTIRSGAGDDSIAVDPSVTINLIIEAGDGADTVQGGSGNDRIDGGAGNDRITTGSGFGYVFGGSGDDTIRAGNGTNTLYGGDGVDTINGGNGNDYIEGGKGNDVINSGGGRNVVSGGLGDDTIAAAVSDRVYTGGGTNTVGGLGSDGVVYSAGVGDRITGSGNADPSVVNVVLNSSAGLSGVRLEGSDAFVQRVEADLELLRASPNGQQMLAEFDSAAARGNIVTIRELQNVDNGYAQSVPGSDIGSNGRPGRSGPVDISYNPAFAIPQLPVPSVTLFHEMSHAYNGVNGTFLPGTYNGPGVDQGRVPNAERQAVGLDSTARPYDFDGDPNTPATTHNPIPLTENGLRAEMGLALRPSYVI